MPKPSAGSGLGQKPDLTLPLRPFMNRYAQGISGPRKFALLVARLSGGDSNAEVPGNDIERQWNKMKGLLGGAFNPAYSTRAKDNGWVDSPKMGVYILLPGWEGALANG